MIKSITSDTTLSSTRPTKKLWFWVALAVLVIFHAVGFWGLMFSNNPKYFQELTPLNLLLTNLLLFSLHRNWDGRFILFVIVVAIAGFLAEVIGVHTGVLFGQYKYGNALGLKIADVPLLIGLNWLMLVYSTGTLVNKIESSKWVKALAGAGLMLLLDFFLEPVAMQFDFWSWQGYSIPLSNYIGWFGLGFLLHLYFQYVPAYKQNPLAVWVYVVQLIFFAALYLFV